MAYTVPTPTDLKLRYPEFQNVADARVLIFINEAARSVDESWTEGDYASAINALAAHKMSLEGEPLLSSGVSKPGGIAVGEVKKRKVGDVETEFVTSADSATGSGGANAFSNNLNRTLYGNYYLQLLKLNKPAVTYV